MLKMTKKRSIALATLGLAGLMSIGIVAAQADPGHSSVEPTPMPTSSVSVDDNSVDAPASHDVADADANDVNDANDANDNDVNDVNDANETDANDLADPSDDDPATHEAGGAAEHQGSEHAATPAIPAVPAHHEDGENHAATPATPAVPATHDVKDDHGDSGHGSDDSGSDD